MIDEAHIKIDFISGRFKCIKILEKEKKRQQITNFFFIRYFQIFKVLKWTFNFEQGLGHRIDVLTWVRRRDVTW